MDKKLNYTVPPTLEVRNNLRELIAVFIDRSGLVPPLSRRQLTAISMQIIDNEGLQPDFLGWIMVEMNNRLWSEIYTTIPYERRILLLPKCLSNSAACTAEIDELGLLCRRCGKCSISSLEEKAEKLGIMTLVAEGITSTGELIEQYGSGAVDAVIGVGCLEALEKSFPLFVDNAVPAMAIALNCAGCKDTDVDTDYVEKIVDVFVGTARVPSLHLNDYENLKTSINQWFSSENYDRLLGDTSDHTSSIARRWICGEGKRWRPFLLASVYMAITGNKHIPETVKFAAIAVESFHKASLIHDDIQDNDDFRYGKPTINSLHGVPIAINVGDKLLGDGYRLLSECGMIELVQEASAAHIALCRGQGLELEWCNNPRPLNMDDVIYIFENKTAPAFCVALSLAVICAKGDESMKAIMEQYAHALGIAYQLLDDLDDFQSGKNVRLRPTAVLAAICENSENKHLVEKLLLQEYISELMNECKPQLENAIARVTAMAEDYKQQAIDSLVPLKNVELKRLLFRITKKILR